MQKSVRFHADHSARHFKQLDYMCPNCLENKFVVWFKQNDIVLECHACGEKSKMPTKWLDAYLGKEKRKPTKRR